MNFYAVIHYLGWVFEVSGVSLLMPAVVGLVYHEQSWKYYLIVALCCILIGTVTIIKKPKNISLFAKEGFVTVALAWVFMSLIGAVPFFASGEIKSYLDAVFETASGFTTTGASILNNVSGLSHAALFWRSFTHWLGGMGVLVFLIALIPKGRGGGMMQLMKAESPGPSVGKIVPKIRETAIILYILYSFLTILETIFLLFGGMPWFDAITTAFSTAGTGGFSIRNSSIAYYHSAYFEIIITVFMILFGVNFSIYYLILNKRLKEIRSNEEIRAYFIIIIVAITAVTLNISRTPIYENRIGDALRDASFSVASIISTTGFGTADFDKWPEISKFILLLLMFIGSMAGSTGGGLKVSRLIILLKSSFNEISNFAHPRSIRTPTLDGKKIDSKLIRQTKSYFAIYIVIFALSILIICFDNFDFSTNVSAVAATFNNIGPGFSIVGPTGNYALFSPLSKVVLIFDMLAGRLELFPMLILFSPTVFKDTLSSIGRHAHLPGRRS